MLIHSNSGLMSWVQLVFQNQTTRRKWWYVGSTHRISIINQGLYYRFGLGFPTKHVIILVTVTITGVGCEPKTYSTCQVAYHLPPGFRSSNVQQHSIHQILSSSNFIKTSNIKNQKPNGKKTTNTCQVIQSDLFIP